MATARCGFVISGSGCRIHHEGSQLKRYGHLIWQHAGKAPRSFNARPGAGLPERTARRCDPNIDIAREFAQHGTKHPFVLFASTGASGPQPTLKLIAAKGGFGAQFDDAYWLGDRPVCDLKARQKLLGAEYPRSNAMDETGTWPNGSQYLCTHTDGEGVPLDGANRSMMATSQKFPALSSYDDLARNNDGTVDLYLGPEAPAGMKVNWIEIDPAKGWTAIMRLYGPLEPFFDQSWKMSDFGLVD